MNTGRTPGAAARTTCLPLGVLYGFVAAANLLLPASCTPGPRQVALRQLADPANEVRVARRRAVLRDYEPVAPLVTPLAGHIGLLRVRDEQEWDRLSRAAQALGPRPDFRAGSIVGVVSRCGSRVDGSWPIELQGVHVRERLGMVVAASQSGCYLPDAVTQVEFAWVAGLSRVAVVDIDGQRILVE